MSDETRVSARIGGEKFDLGDMRTFAERAARVTAGIRDAQLTEGKVTTVPVEYPPREYELTRGALRALALGAAKPDDKRDYLQAIRIDRDHGGVSTDGHLAIYVEPTDDDDDDCDEGSPVLVPAEEVLRIKSEKPRRSDIATVRVRGDRIRVTVPTDVQVETTDHRAQASKKRVEVHTIQTTDPAQFPDTRNPGIFAPLAEGDLLFTISPDLLDTVVKVAKETGALSIDVKRQPAYGLAALRQPLGFVMQRTGEDRETVSMVVMPMGHDDAPDKRGPAADEETQATIPGTEPRPQSLADFCRSDAVRLIGECVSMRTLVAWRNSEEARGEDDIRPEVIAAIDARLDVLSPAREDDCLEPEE